MWKHYIVHGFQPETGKFDFGIKVERASQDEQSGADLSFVAPSSEEFLVWREIFSVRKRRERF